MLTRLLASILIVAATPFAPSLPAAAQSASPVQWVRVHLPQPTLVYGKVLTGDYVLVHDEAKAARGEPCTAFYRSGRGESPVVAFHCVRQHRTPAAKLTLVVSPTPRRVATGAIKIVELLEYQFAGDSDAHEVPAI